MPEGLWGDYNNDGTIEGVDYTVWRDNLGNPGALFNDLTPDSVDEFDFDLWRSNYGGTLGSGSGQGTANVPEPARWCS